MIWIYVDIMIYVINLQNKKVWENKDISLNLLNKVISRFHREKTILSTDSCDIMPWIEMVKKSDMPLS